MITLDHLGEPVMINRAARDLFGWSDLSESELSDDKIILELSERFTPLLSENKPILEHEFDIAGPDGSPLPLMVSAALVSADTINNSEQGKKAGRLIHHQRLETDPALGRSNSPKRKAGGGRSPGGRGGA